MFDPIINALPAFGLYFVSAIALLGVFLTIYALITPYSELELIRNGNVAAAISLGGALIGIALPVANAVVASHNVVLMLGWGTVACIVQLLVFLFARLVMPQICKDIPANKLSAGIFLATLSIGVGIINAACLL